MGRGGAAFPTGVKWDAGGPAFAAIGSGQSTGTKLLCVSGAVAHPGVCEAVLGTTLRRLLDLGGGVTGDLRVTGGWRGCAPHWLR